MRPRIHNFQSVLAEEIEAFIAHKRALRRRYVNESKTLQLLDRYLVEQKVNNISAICPEMIAAFLDSRPRTQPRSYNHLRGVVSRLFDWLVVHEKLMQSPVRIGPRRTIFDAGWRRIWRRWPGCWRSREAPRKRKPWGEKRSRRRVHPSVTITRGPQGRG